MDFKQAYSFPLKEYYGRVFTSGNDKAIDFANEWLFNDPYRIDKETKTDIISVINGFKTILHTDFKLEYKSDEGMIYTRINDISQPFIVIRGWGHLTGIGGLNLPDDVAYQLQDDFAKHIVKSITDAYQTLDKSA